MNRLLELCNIKEGDYIERTFSRTRLVDDTEGDVKCAVAVLSGRVDVFAISPDGKEVLLTSLEKDALFGISNLFREDDLRTVLQCREKSTLAFIPKELLKERILNNTEAMKEYSILCNSKIQFLLSRIEQLSLNTAKAKLIEYLLTEGDKAILTRDELASHLGISRAALFREIATLQSKGAIETKGSRLTVIDRDKLEKEEY